MLYQEIIGYIGTLLTVLSFLPVVITIYKTKKTNNFPYSAIFLATSGNLLILINGILTKNNVLIFMGSIFLIIYVFIIFIKLHFKIKD